MRHIKKKGGRCSCLGNAKSHLINGTPLSLTYSVSHKRWKPHAVLNHVLT